MTAAAGAFSGLGVAVPEVLLPAEGTEPGTWAVVACDQYSSEREYWEKVDALVGDRPSTLRLIYPECYLEEADKATRVAGIQAAMADYLARGLLRAVGPGLVLVERFTPYEREARVGLLMAVDLEEYRYGRDSKSLIRPTEGTIVERLPPRMEIRRGALLELPHVMILVDDPERSVIEPLYARRERLPKLYDFDLMLGSGRIRGWKVADSASLASVASALRALADPGSFRARYGNDEVLLFAVGDGNHSLATAKAVWEETKASIPAGDPLRVTHPARFALVELVNVYSEGLPFHPIHRLLVGADEGRLREALRAAGALVEGRNDAAAAFDEVDASSAEGAVAQRVGLVSAWGAAVVTFPSPTHRLAAGSVQTLLDPFVKGNAGVSIDYIHGRGSLGSLASKPGSLGLYLPPIDKSGFFGTVVRDGAMPRKTFSMGEAPEKRFYLEARRIRP